MLKGMKIPSVAKKSLFVLFLVLLLVALSIFYIVSFLLSDPGEPLSSDIYADVSGRDLAGFWSDGGIECISRNRVDEDGPVGTFFLTMISINGENEPIPANIGTLSNCVAEVWTESGGRGAEVYFYPVKTNKTLTLEDLIFVWGGDLERSGQDMRISVNGEVFDDTSSVILEDGQEIYLEYRRSR